MIEPKLRDLLTEVADDVEPHDRLDAIRARTRRARPPYWIPAGAALVAASVVGAVALSGGPAEQAADPGPAGSSSTSPAPSEPSPTTGESTPSPTTVETTAVAVYHVGDTPDGPRLYREFRRLPADDPLSVATEALRLPPIDPDYTNLWPADAIGRVSFDGIGADGLITITLADASYRDRPAGVTAEEAGLAVEQVIRTFQAAVQARTPVQFRLDDNPIDQVLGVPSSEPLAQAPDLDVLARVSISSPSEGQQMDNDGELVVSGVGNSFEGNIVVRVVRSGPVAEKYHEEPTIAGWGPDRLYPFEVTLDLSHVPPGEYLVSAQTDDPSGEGRFHSDTRLITVTQ